MGIEKVRIAMCDSRDCDATAVHQKDKLPAGWDWWHVKWPVGGGCRIKVAESRSYDMYLFCPKCSASTDVPHV